MRNVSEKELAKEIARDRPKEELVQTLRGSKQEENSIFNQISLNAPQACKIIIFKSVKSPNWLQMTAEMMMTTDDDDVSAARNLGNIRIQA
jgi:hypothetical protein